MFSLDPQHDVADSEVSLAPQDYQKQEYNYEEDAIQRD